MGVFVSAGDDAEGFFFDVGAVDGVEFLECGHPRCGLVEVGDFCELSSKLVDGFTGVGACAVDEDLVVNAVWVWCVRDVDVPVGGEASGQCCAADAVVVGAFCHGVFAGGVVDEGAEHCSVVVVGASFDVRGSTGGVFAAPAGGAFGGGAVFLHFSGADGASGSVLFHANRKPHLISQVRLGWRY